jgi:drug/metabolite transporter (DMT)-like permease
VPFGWVKPAAFDLLFLCGIAVANIVAQFCVIRSLKLASASVVVPYQYMLILWSVLLGWQIFGELPDAYTVVGATIIVAAGLYIFWREQVAARATALTPPPSLP